VRWNKGVTPSLIKSDTKIDHLIEAGKVSERGTTVLPELPRDQHAGDHGVAEPSTPRWRTMDWRVWARRFRIGVSERGERGSEEAMRSKTMLMSVIIALGLVTAACSSGGSGDSGGSPTGAPSGGGGGGGSGTATISISNFAFEPNALTGSPGETLEITVTNNDSTTHSFTADDGSVTQDISSGESATVTVTLPSSGTFGWHCRFHSSMTGTITVG
jgi:plastocyanin